MANCSAASTADNAERRPLRLLCLHGHGGHASQVCGKLQDFFSALTLSDNQHLPVSEGGLLPAVECRCVEAPFIEPSRREQGRQWWRYDESGMGDRPDDWAEMEHANTMLAEELHQAHLAATPYDGVLGFSQGAEMVHSLALLKHRQDPRLMLPGAPRFFISLSGAVNPAHFEAPGGGPPRDCIAPSTVPSIGEISTPCLFLGDFSKDGWYSASRFSETLKLYSDATLVQHDKHHTVPKSLSATSARTIRSFLARFVQAD